MKDPPKIAEKLHSWWNLCNAGGAKYDYSRQVHGEPLLRMDTCEQKNTELLESLVKAYQARLRSYVYSRTGSTDAADDIVQEIFLVAFKHLDQYDSNRPAWPWLMGYARISLFDHWRASERDTNSKRLKALVALKQLERDEQEQPESNLQAKIDRLRHCQDKLPLRSKELVGLIYNEHFTCEQVAERWKTGAGAVRVALHRIRKALKTCVESRLSESPA